MARRLIGLDVGTNAVTVAEVSAGSIPRLDLFAQVALPRDAMREGEVADDGAVSEAPGRDAAHDQGGARQRAQVPGRRADPDSHRRRGPRLRDRRHRRARRRPADHACPARRRPRGDGTTFGRSGRGRRVARCRRRPHGACAHPRPCREHARTAARDGRRRRRRCRPRRRCRGHRLLRRRRDDHHRPRRWHSALRPSARHWWTGVDGRHRVGPRDSRRDGRGVEASTRRAEQ